jgi:hypothetical protein
MTVFLKPEPGCEPLMEDWIRQEVVERFGDRDLLFEEEGSALVLRGPEKGQILYLAYEPGWMIVSNSESGWKDVQLVLARQRASIVEKQSFREIQKQIGSQYDLFLYFGGEGGWMLPEFGYSVNIDGQHVCDAYYSIDP